MERRSSKATNTFMLSWGSLALGRVAHVSGHATHLEARAAERIAHRGHKALGNIDYLYSMHLLLGRTS
jgi:hypothetical protein